VKKTLFSKLLKNVMNAAETRKKEAKKRSLHSVKEPFEPLSDAVPASVIVLQQPANTGADKEIDDGALFRSTIGEISPLPDSNLFTPVKPPLPAKVRDANTQHRVADTLSDFPFENSPEEFLRNGLQKLTLRKLKRGTYPAQAKLDLHGYTSDEARKMLQEFLYDAALRKLRCVRVIHGKGMNSQGGEAVLRRLTRNWLTQHPQVLAFCAAPPEKGGHGAVLVLLKVDH